MNSSTDFDIATKTLFHAIISDNSLSPIDLYCTVQKIQIFLSNFANLPNDYSTQLLKEFSKDQILTLDYNGFYYLIENMISRCYPILKDLLPCESFFCIGDQVLLEKLIVNLLLCKLIDYDDKDLSDTLNQKILPFCTENLIGSDHLADLDVNFLNYQTQLVDYIPKLPNTLNDIKIEVYAERLRFLMGIFAICKTPSRYYSASQIAKLVFTRFINFRVLDTLSKFFDPNGDKNLYSDILAVFTMFLSLFKYKENFVYYDEIIMQNGLQKDYLQNFIVNLNSIALAALSSGYFDINLDYLTYITCVIE